MTNEDQRAPLIVRIIEAIIDDARSLELDTEPLTRRVNWRAKVNVNDAGKLIGKKGAHLKAIRVLVGLMGQHFGEVWHVSVDDPDEGPIHEKPPIEPAANYNPALASQFLLEILETFLADAPEIGVERAGDEFLFVIRPRNVGDYEKLVEEYNLGREQLAPVAALGTLFRAYGRQQGVTLRIEVPGRKEQPLE